MDRSNPVEERKTFCRLCMTHCGMIVSVDSDEQIVGIRPDREDLTSKGFACFKGLQAPEAHNAQIRIRQPMKKREDGTFEEIQLEQALDEIADKLRAIIARDGPEAVGAYRGSGAGMNAAAGFLIDGLLQGLGSPKIFSAATIDQSAKFVAEHRLGTWSAGAYYPWTCDVVLMVGTNPLVSLSPVFKAHKMLPWLKKEVERGLKVLTIDPRKTETGRLAHLNLQPLPGEDTAILSGMIRLILERGWEDTEFLARHAIQLAELRKAVEPFTPEYVAQRAGVPIDDFTELTREFAEADRAVARSGTGANMGPHSNLVEHLVGCLNVVCGCFKRAGEKIENPGVFLPRTPKMAQAVPAQRVWDKGYKSRVGDYGLIYGELPTGIMADEILEPGPGQIKAFFCHGGNAAVIVPDQGKVVEALRSLDLLVTIDCFWNPTCELSDYVLPTPMQYERPDLPVWQAEAIFYDYVPYARYTHAVAKPPKDANVATDVYIVWSIAKRLGVSLTWLGQKLDPEIPPRVDDLLRIAASNVPIAFEELQDAELGMIVDVEPQFVEEGNPGADDRFNLCPADILGELREVAAEPVLESAVLANGERATHRFAVRRHRDVFNSTQRGLEATLRRLPHNTANLHPDDLEKMGIDSGDLVRITSTTAAVDVVATADESVRPGVVTMVHGFGVLPEKTDPFEHGASANYLIGNRSDNRETINAMPRMSGFPVHIRKADRINIKATAV